MPTKTKILAIVLVLGTGAAAAFFFRKVPQTDAGTGTEALSQSDSQENLLPLQQTSPQRLDPVATADALNEGGLPTSSLRASVAETAPSNPPPPNLAPTFERTLLATERADDYRTEHSRYDDGLAPLVSGNQDRTALKPIGSRQDDFVVRPAQGVQRTHTIRDGDSLHKIAQRYLDDANRWQEIFDLNRDVLTTADLLPLGAKLHIPAKSNASSFIAPNERPLVPLRRSR